MSVRDSEGGVRVSPSEFDMDLPIWGYVIILCNGETQRGVRVSQGGETQRGGSESRRLNLIWISQ